MRLNFVLSFISILLFFGFSYAKDNFKNIEIEGLESMSKNEFLYLLGVEEDKTIDKNKITEGIKRVFLKDIFDDIIVEDTEVGLKVIVKEKPFIESIEITGNKQFSKEVFKKILTFKKGERLKHLELRSSEIKIGEYLKKRGFPDYKIKTYTNCEKSKCDVRITIDEGQPLIVKNIQFEGDIDENIKENLPLKCGYPFDRILLEEFIQTIKKYYEKQKLIGTDIKYLFKDGSLEIKVTKGRYIEIDILGVESLSKKDLLNIINAYFKDTINDNIIKDSVNSLISFYRANGFIDVRIYPLIEQKESTWNIKYVINEGKRKFIEKLDINLPDVDKEIRTIIINREGMPFIPDELESDRQRIENYLKNKGYYYAQVFPAEINEKDENVRISFQVKEGQLVKIKSFSFNVENDILRDEALNLLKKYESEIFNDSVFLEIKRKIREIYLKNGYPDTVIEGRYEVKDNEAYIDISVNPKTKKYFGKSIILGNKKTKTGFIYNRLLPKEDKSYNPYTLEEERQTLYKTGLFSRLDIISQTNDDRVDTIYEVEEAPAGAFEFGLGYGEYEKAKGFAELSYINLFGMNKQIFSRIELSKLEERSYITYIDPWFWKDLTLKASLNFENVKIKNIDTKDIIYKLKRYGFSAGFEKKFLDYFKAELLYEATYSKTWDVMPEVVISDIDIGEIFVSGIKASLIYDSRDNPFDPKKGWLAGVTSKISSNFLGSEINFMKTSFYLNKYTEIMNSLILAASIRAGWAWLYGNTKDLPISERYFLGGRDTVRGYAQNMLGPKRDNQPTGGNAFLMGNIELRTYLGKNFFLVNFLDFGNVWNRVGDINPSDLKYTTGIGLRYKTPVGPVRIDYGYKLNRQKDETHGEIHFSIGHAF